MLIKRKCKVENNKFISMNIKQKMDEERENEKVEVEVFGEKVKKVEIFFKSFI